MSLCLFQGEYYLANTYAQKEEVIHSFLEGDYKTLVIIDESFAIENIKNICGESDIPCSVEFLSDKSIPCTKGIYISTFDTAAQNFIKENWSLLAFFTLTLT
jgi:hypothetical protein